MAINPTELTALLISDPSEPTAIPTQVAGVTGLVNVSAGIELQSINRALLLSRMTTAQRDAISVPYNGMILYNSTTNRINSYQNSVWGAGGSGDVLGPSASTVNAVSVYGDTTGKEIINTLVTLNPVTAVINGLAQLFSGSGSVANPTYTFANSTAGIYLRSANIIGFAGNGGVSFSIDCSAVNAVNYFQVGGAATTTSPFLQVIGADANIDANFLSKGTGLINFLTDGTALSPIQLQITHTATAVNNLRLTGSTTTNALPIAAFGNDANISISAVPKGTGAFLLPRGGAANPGIGFSGSANSSTSGLYYLLGGGAPSTFIGTSISGVSLTALNTNGVLSIGTTTFDATFANGLSIAVGTAPTGAVVNCMEIYTSITTGTNTIPSIYAVIDGGNVAGNVVNNTAITAVNLTNSIALKINGTVYYIPASILRS